MSLLGRFFPPPSLRIAALDTGHAARLAIIHADGFARPWSTLEFERLLAERNVMADGLFLRPGSGSHGLRHFARGDRRGRDPDRRPRGWSTGAGLRAAAALGAFRRHVAGRDRPRPSRGGGRQSFRRWRFTAVTDLVKSAGGKDIMAGRRVPRRRADHATRSLGAPVDCRGSASRISSRKGGPARSRSRTWRCETPERPTEAIRRHRARLPGAWACG